MHRLTHSIASAVLAMFPAAASAEYFAIDPVPSSAPEGFSQLFTKHVDVLGLHVYASLSVADGKVLHAANVLAQWVDNNEDGVPDDAAVHAEMISLHASMLMWSNEWEFEHSGAEFIIPDSVWDSTVLQLLFGQETNPGYPQNNQFDWSLEECLHLVTWGGFSRVYPDTFGEMPGSQIADAMDANIAGGWYHYDDPTCDYACLVTEYHYWALTSWLGAQDYPWRIPEIADEWELPTPSLLQQHDAAVVSLLTDGQWNQPSVLPNGAYDPQVTDCPADLNGDGTVAVDDILALLAAFGTNGPDGDINGDGIVDVVDVLLLLQDWGDCP